MNPAVPNPEVPNPAVPNPEVPNPAVPNPAVGVRCAVPHCRSASAPHDPRDADHLASVPCCVRHHLAGCHTNARPDDHWANRRVVADRWIRHLGAAAQGGHRRGGAWVSPVEDLCDAHRARRRRCPHDHAPPDCFARHSSDLPGPTVADVRSLMGVGRTA